jgi:hypothetical protein
MQADTVTELTAAEAIDAKGLLEGFLEGKYRIAGKTEADKREYTIRLIDVNTGREYVIKDIFNKGGASGLFGGTTIDWEATLSAPDEG